MTIADTYRKQQHATALYDKVKYKQSYTFDIYI